MKRYILLTVLCSPLVLGAQIDFRELTKGIGPSIRIGTGTNACIIPSRKNFLSIGDGKIREQTFSSMPNYAIGVEGLAEISPLRNDYFSYTFKANGSIGWLFYSSQSFLYFSHEIRVGLQNVKGIFEIGRFRQRRASHYKASYTGATSYQETLGRSTYDDTRRISPGIAITFWNNSMLEARYIREFYDFDNKRATGFAVSFMTKKSMTFYAEAILDHPVRGAYLVNLPAVPALNTEYKYIRAGVVKTFGKKSDYKRLLGSWF